MSQPATPPLPDDLSRAYSQPQAPAVNPADPLAKAVEAIVIEAPPPSVAPGPGVPARVPHIGHAILFVSIAAIFLVIFSSLLVGFVHPVVDPHKVAGVSIK